jgi:hypothetical protein
MIHAQNPVVQEAVSAILGGSAIPLIAREVYYAASELQLLENGIRRFKDKMTALIQAGMNTEQRRVASGDIWENTKVPAKKDLDTELLKELCLEDWAQASDAQHSKRLSGHSALKKQVINAVTDMHKMKRATALVDSLG